MSDGASQARQVSAGTVLGIVFSVPALLAILKIDFFLSFKSSAALTPSESRFEQVEFIVVRTMRRHWRRDFISRDTAAALGNLVDRSAFRHCPLWNRWIQIHEFHEVGLRGVLIPCVADARACTNSSSALSQRSFSIPSLTRSFSSYCGGWLRTSNGPDLGRISPCDRTGPVSGGQSG